MILIVLKGKKSRCRGSTSRTDAFGIWARRIAKAHKEVLLQAGVYKAILATRRKFKFDKHILAAFLQFWAPSTNSFHLSCGISLLSNHTLLLVSTSAG